MWSWGDAISATPTAFPEIKKTKLVQIVKTIIKNHTKYVLKCRLSFFFTKNLKLANLGDNLS